MQPFFYLPDAQSNLYFTLLKLPINKKQLKFIKTLEQQRCV